MIDKYVGLEQYKRSIDSIKEYVDKSIPHGEPEVIFTLPADKVLEIYNSDITVMEFDKPSNINLDYNFIINYNNEDITDISIMDNGDFKIIFLNNNNIVIGFAPGVDINQNINENKMVVVIEELNTDITPTDVVLKQIKIKYLNNKYLKNNVAIRNSITIGSRQEGHDIGQYSFSNGEYNISSGNNSHAEGYNTTALEKNSHAEGTRTRASGHSSHAEGHDTIASGYSSHAEGSSTKASSQYQHVQGKYNIEDSSNVYAHIVGNGNSSLRSNAHTLDWSGNAWYQGDVYVGGNSQDDTNAKKMATEEFVNNNKITKTSELTNDSGFITSIPDEYITETELIAKNYIDNTTLENKGYLTEHQSLKGLATETYVDSKFKSEEIIFDGETNDPLIIHDYYTQHPAAGGMGCLVIDKSIEINSNNNPYYLDMDGTIYPPDKSTYNSTNNAWEYSIDNGMDVFIGNDYEGQNKIVVSWDPVNYSHLKIYTKIDLIESINNKADKSQLVGLATENYVNNRFLNIDIASTSWVQNSGGLYELTYTHNLASENITVQVYNTDSKYEMFVDTQIVDSNSIKITSDENPNCAIRIVKF